MTDCILELLSHITCQHSHLPVVPVEPLFHQLLQKGCISLSAPALPHSSCEHSAQGAPLRTLATPQHEEDPKSITPGVFSLLSHREQQDAIYVMSLASDLVRDEPAISKGWYLKSGGTSHRTQKYSLLFVFRAKVQRSPFPNMQLLSKHIPERSLDLTWSFSGLSEMSLRLVEVRFR